MKTQYNSLSELTAEIERQEASKADYLAPAADIRLADDNTLELDGIGNFGLNSHAHSQVASKFGIPKRYYDDIGNVPGLRAYSVNALNGANPDRKHFVRTLDNTARALLSDRFRPIDNMFVMNAFLPAVQPISNDIQVRANVLSDRRLYLQISSKRYEGDVKVGDPVQAGIILTNSEVGAGAVDIKSLIWRLVCSNGMIGQSILRQMHAGKRIDEDNIDIYSDDTLKAEMKSLSLRMRDMIAHSLSESVFKEQLERLQIANGQEIAKPRATIENVTKQFTGIILTDEIDKIEANMAKEGNISKYGLANGITNLAHSIENPDRAYEIEKLGAKIISLEPSQWEVVNAS